MTMRSGGRPAGITAEIAEGYEIAGSGTGRGLVMLCDHASNRLPPEYGTLGLDPVDLERHIAYDIGIAGVARHLSAALDAPAVLLQQPK